MAKSDEDGVWRTIGGRRVFIKDGQSVSDAMKSSGKFKGKGKQKKSENDNFISKNSLNEDDDLDSIEEKMENLASKMDDMTDNEQESDPSFEKMEKEYDKLLEKQKELQNADMPSSGIDSSKVGYTGKTDDEDYSDYEYPEEITTKAQWKEDYGDNIEELERDLKESEMYLDEDSEGYAEAKKSLENGKEYLNELKSKSNSNIHDELLKEKQDRLSKQKSLEKDAKKYVQDESKTRDDYIRDKMKQGVRTEDSREAYNRELEKKMSRQEKQIRKNLNNEENKYSLKQIKEVYKKEDYTEVINTLSQREISKMNEAQFDMDTSSKGNPAYKNAEDYIERMENKAATKWLDKNSKTMNNKIRDEAFKKYMKEHPGSKMTLKEFLKK